MPLNFYWFNYWHTLKSKDMSGFTSITLLIRFPVNAIFVVLPVFIVSYRIAKCIREITRVIVMCRYLMTNDLI